MTITLQALTENLVIDSVLTAVVGIFELAFPKLIQAYYLTGSYYDMVAVSASDLDLLVIVKGALSDADRKLLQEMDGWCELLSVVPLDIGFFGVEEIQRHCPTNLKLSSLFLYGEDIRDSLTLPDPSAYLRECMHRAFHRLLWIRHHPNLVSYPLTYPDPAGEFYGYEVRKTDEIGHLGQPTTERLIGNLLWMATAQLTAATSSYYSSKTQVIAGHQTIFANEWSKFIENAYHLCRNEWAYHIPEKLPERAKLRQLCAQVLKFENEFFQQYHAFLLNELSTGNEEAKQEATKRLNRIQFA